MAVAADSLLHNLPPVDVQARVHRLLASCHQLRGRDTANAPQQRPRGGRGGQLCGQCGAQAEHVRIFDDDHVSVELAE